MNNDLSAGQVGLYKGVSHANTARDIIHKGHSPHFDVAERSLSFGVEIMTEAIRSYLS